MLIKLVHYIERSAHAIEFIKDLFLCPLFKKAMNRCGHNVKIKPSTSVYYGLNNLSLGNNVSIPRYAHIFCTEAPLYIGDNVIFGPAPTIVTGDHRIDQIGTPTFFTTEKKAENDLPVIIEDDVWIGAHVTILKGVTIGRGSVVAAGSVVNKSCRPYSIIGGIQAKLLKYRFSRDEILQHEQTLYIPEKRLTDVELSYLSC